MTKFTAERLHEIADEFERDIDNPESEDDPKYLKRWANKVRKLAMQKEAAKEHKDNQK